MHETQNIFGVSIVNLKLANLGFKYAIILILIALNLSFPLPYQKNSIGRVSDENTQRSARYPVQIRQE